MNNMGNTQSKLGDIEEETMTIPIPMKIKDYNQEIHGEWIKYTMSKPGHSVGIGGIHIFDVYVLVQDDKVYMKPVEKILTYEFEQLFGFGISCDRYDENKVIQVTSPEDYKKFLIDEN
jgi:hypothetical protein